MRFQDLLLDFAPDPSGSGNYLGLVAAGGAARAALFEDAGSGARRFPFRPPWPANKGRERALEPGRLRTPPDREDGIRLWRALPEAAREAIAAGPAAGSVLRIEISSPSAALHDLPWERLSDGVSLPFALHEKYLVARSLPVRVPKPPRVGGELKALVVSSQPEVKAAFSPGDVNSIVRSIERGGIRVDVLEHASLLQLRDALKLQGPFQVVHFLGHAAVSRGEGHLVLERDGGRLSDWISAAQLSALLPASVGLVCLSSPGSVTNYQILGFARLALSAPAGRLPTVVFEQYQANRDRPSAALGVGLFWEIFYRTLSRGASAPASFPGDRSREGVSPGDVNGAVHATRHPEGDDPAGDDGCLNFAVAIRDGSGVPFEMRRVWHPDDDAKVLAREIRARYEAEKANELAEQVRRLGPEAPGLLRESAFTQKRLAEFSLKELKDTLRDLRAPATRLTE
jgi:hypothetical protein